MVRTHHEAPPFVARHRGQLGVDDVVERPAKGKDASCSRGVMIPRHQEMDHLSLDLQQHRASCLATHFRNRGVCLDDLQVLLSMRGVIRSR